MIFGVPVGTQTVHLSVDITDIGEYSMNPAGMVGNLGYSPNLFTDNNTRIKPTTDLTDLPHIETQEISVNVIPFWGDRENFEIGITRQDFRIKALLTMQFVIFGTSFTDDDNSTWGATEDDKDSGIGNTSWYLYRLSKNTTNNINIESKRGGTITEKIYYYPNEISDEKINGNTFETSADPVSDMRLLSKEEYTSYKTENGDFVFIVNCNRRKKITNEIGNFVDVPDSNQGGIYTEFKGFIIFEYTKDDVPISWNSKEIDTGVFSGDIKMYSLRYRFKFPQYGSSLGTSFTNNDSGYDTFNWRKQHHTFLGGKIYSVARFNGTTYNNQDDDDQDHYNGRNTISGDRVNYLTNNITSLNQTVGVIRNENNPDADQNQINNRLPINVTINNNDIFGANWLNFAIHFPQIARGQRVNYDDFSNLAANTNFNYAHENFNGGAYFFLRDNTQPIAATDINTKWLARADLHWTDFIEVPADDIVKIYNNLKNSAGAIKGFKKTQYIDLELNWDNYRNGYNDNSWSGATKQPAVYSYKTKLDDYTVGSDNIYFYRGIDGADCISYLFDLGILRTT